MTEFAQFDDDEDQRAYLRHQIRRYAGECEDIAALEDVLSHLEDVVDRERRAA